jgi:hypothetical protein
LCERAYAKQNEEKYKCREKLVQAHYYFLAGFAAGVVAAGFAADFFLDFAAGVAFFVALGADAAGTGVV